MNDFIENEALLITALKAGDKIAFSKIYKGYQNRLFGYALTLCKNSAMAEDLIHDVFLSLWNKREAIKTERSLKSLLFISVKNLYIDKFRSTAYKNNLIENLRYEIATEITEDLEDEKKKRLHFLKKAIDVLPTKQKEVFVLHKLKNYQYSEIAAMLNISERTVEGHIRKAFITLRDKAKDWRSPLILLITFLVFSTI